MRKFVDLHLCVPIDNVKQVERLVNLSAELGYRIVGIPLSPDISQERLRQITEICDNEKVEFVTRVDLMPKSSGELLNSLGRLRRKFEIVSVACTSKNVARQAAKDRRVDLLSPCLTFPCKRFFDYAEAELASKKSVAFEIDMSLILSLTGFPKIWLLSSLRKEVAVARKFDIPITISSGASDENFLRKPQDYAALATLFDLPAPLALHAISDYPLSIVERNKGKLSPHYVAPGVHIVRE
jgi:ribonuclease P/MRP protein subunit RPP1